MRPRFGLLIPSENLHIPRKRELPLRALQSIESDLTGDGWLDRFDFIIETLPTDAPPRFDQIAHEARLFLPGGITSVQRILIGDQDGDGDADMLIEYAPDATCPLQQVLLKNESIPEPPALIDESAFAQHLAEVFALRSDGRPLDAFLHSVALTFGLPHMSDRRLPEITATHQWPWMYPNLPRTDCVFDVERVLAEMRCDGSVADFDRMYLAIQFDAQRGGDKNDFFEMEWLPHNTHDTNAVRDITLDAQRWTHTEGASVRAHVDKERWYRATKSGDVPSERDDYRAREESIPYVPFAALFEQDMSSDLPRLTLRPEVDAHLPDVVIFAVVNRDRHFAALGTDIAVSHVGFLARVNGAWRVYHVSMLSTAGLSGPAEEMLDHYARANFYREEAASGLVPKSDMLDVGLMLMIPHW